MSGLMMDLLTRIKDALSGKKRKATYSDEIYSKRSRNTEPEHDNRYTTQLFNSGTSDSMDSYKFNRRQSEPVFNDTWHGNFKTNHVTPASTYVRNQPFVRNASKSNCMQFLNGQPCEFKTPMPPPLTNGTRPLPELISVPNLAYSRARNMNQPQQTIAPHFSKYGERSELAAFRNVPELYSVKSDRPNSSYLANGSMINGHDSQLLSSTQKFGTSRSIFNNSSIRSTSQQPLFNNSSSSLGINPDSILANIDNVGATAGLSRSRYVKLMEMIPFAKKRNKSTPNNTILDGFVDLSDDTVLNDHKTNISSPVPNVPRVNTLKSRLETKEILKDNWETSLNERYSLKQLNRSDSVKKIEKENEECERMTRSSEDKLRESLSKIVISSIVYEEEEEEEPVNDYPELGQDKQQRIYQWISAHDVNTVLVSKFNLSVKRHDIQTLKWCPLTWLNDEVINFYMELLAERSRMTEKLPKVHAMNTFFLTRLLEVGYSGVRRWTRKVDIFAHDVIPVPVHKGIHWCMAIIHLKNKTIKYYDSMGQPNNNVLGALRKYLLEESLDKKKQEFDMSGWQFENVRDIPQQENGSDCGVFSCMYAEFVTRNRPIVFSQQHMQYFRQKMVYEICTGQMLN